MTDVAIHVGLFASAFLSATIIPGQSEAILMGLLLAGYSPALLLTLASIGNVLGSVLNWALGRGLEQYRDRRWFPVDAEALGRAQRWYGRYGKWTLLLSWVPIVGDPLTLVAGLMRERLGVFLVLVSLAKVGRYLVLMWVTLRYVT